MSGSFVMLKMALRLVIVAFALFTPKLSVGDELPFNFFRDEKSGIRFPYPKEWQSVVPAGPEGSDVVAQIASSNTRAFCVVSYKANGVEAISEEWSAEQTRQFTESNRPLMSER